MWERCCDGVTARYGVPPAESMQARTVFRLRLSFQIRTSRGTETSIEPSGCGSPRSVARSSIASSSALVRASTGRPSIRDRRASRWRSCRAKNSVQSCCRSATASPFEEKPIRIGRGGAAAWRQAAPSRRLATSCEASSATVTTGQVGIVVPAASNSVRWMTMSRGFGADPDARGVNPLDGDRHPSRLRARRDQKFDRFVLLTGENKHVRVLSWLAWVVSQPAGCVRRSGRPGRPAACPLRARPPPSRPIPTG